MDIYFKYSLLQDDFNLVSKENEKLRRQIVNQDRQIENLKRKLGQNNTESYNSEG